MADLRAEVDRFREWADSLPPESRFAEWECDYQHWTDFYDAVLDFVADGPPEEWPDGDLNSVLYALARDNEMEYLSEEIRLRHPATLLALAWAALIGGEADAKWQLADQLGYIGRDDGDVERILLALVRDEDEYVRRRALQSLARIGSAKAEQLALEAWNPHQENQQWTRMMVLDCLRRINSPHFQRLLAEAERDERTNLRDFAKRLRHDD